MKFKILIVDNNEDLSNTLEDYLFNEGYYVKTEKDPFAALEMIKEENFFVVLVDFDLYGMCGIDFLREVRNYRATTQVIMMVESHKLSKLVECIEAGANDYLKKPIENLSDVKNLINIIFEKFERWI